MQGPSMTVIFGKDGVQILEVWFTFPSPPPAKSLLAGLELLYALKAIDSEGHLTPKGVEMAELPLKPMCGKMLVTSGEYGCIDEILSIVSMLQVEGVFVNSRKGAASRVRRNNFEVAEGDIIMYLNVFDAFSKIRDNKRTAKDWCQKMYINYRVMEKACEIRINLEKLVKNKFGLKNKEFEGPDLGSGKTVRIMKAVVSGLFPYAARLTAAGYRGVGGAELYISPDSCLYSTQQPSWVVFASVQSSHQTFMRELMAVERDWLLEIAPDYYKLT